MVRKKRPPRAEGFRGYSDVCRVATAADLSEPFMCELDQAGNFYIADSGNHRVRIVHA